MMRNSRGLLTQSPSTNSTRRRTSELRLKLPEARFQFPLLRGLFAALEKLPTSRFGIFSAERFAGTSRGGSAKTIPLSPKTVTRKETVLQAGAHQFFELGVSEVVGFHGAHKFMR